MTDLQERLRAAHKRHGMRICVEAADRIEELEAYSDKLAAGLPEGMLPADVENLRESNAEMAAEIERLKAKLGIPY